MTQVNHTIDDTSEALQQQLRNVRLLILDVDGVLTDGRLILGDDGQEYKAFHANDGLGMRLLQESGVELAIITARNSNVVRLRAEELQIRHLYQGQRDKNAAYKLLLQETSLQTDQTAYMGDDVIDLPVMTQCGVALTPANGHTLVKQHAHWCSSRSGGNGAVREACELIMHAQGSHEQVFARFLQ